MQRLQPSMSGVRIPGLARVVFPGRLELFERAVAARLPWHVDQQLVQRAQALFTAAKVLVVHVALYEVGREPREDIEETKIALARHMRRFPMRRDHADEFASPGQQRS